MRDLGSPMAASTCSIQIPLFLFFLERTGCNAFELTEDQDLEEALGAFSEMSDVYQPSADNGRLIFSRRRTVH